MNSNDLFDCSGKIFINNNRKLAYSDELKNILKNSGGLAQFVYESLKKTKYKSEKKTKNLEKLISKIKKIVDKNGKLFKKYLLMDKFGIGKKIWKSLCVLLNSFDDDIGKENSIIISGSKWTIKKLGFNGGGFSNKGCYILEYKNNEENKKFFIKTLRPNAAGNGFDEYVGAMIVKEFGYPILAPLAVYQSQEKSFIIYPYVDNFLTVSDAFEKGFIDNKKFDILKEKISEIKSEINQKMDELDKYNGYDLVDFKPQNCLYSPKEESEFLLMDVFIAPEKK